MHSETNIDNDLNEDRDIDNSDDNGLLMASFGEAPRQCDCKVFIITLTVIFLSPFYEDNETYSREGDLCDYCH